MRKDSGEGNDDNDGKSGAAYRVPGLEKGLNILSEFSMKEPTLSAPVLSGRLGIPRTTVFRLLQTLESLGFIERVGNSRDYRLGVAVLRLGFDYLSSLDMTDLGTPIIEALRDDTGYTTHMLILDARDVVFIAKAQSNAVQFSSVKVNIGTRLPAHATAHGHVLMGDLSMTELMRLYPERELRPYTVNTPKTAYELYEIIQADLKRGYGIGRETFEYGISVVTAPVRNRKGKIAAAIATTVPGSRNEGLVLEEGLAQKVKDAADKLSSYLN